MSVIVLTAAGHFWGEVTDFKRVLKWMLKDKIEVIKYDDNRYIQSAGDFGRGGTIIRFRMPLVVMLLQFTGMKAKSEAIAYSKDAVYHRDNNICQYWHDYILHEDGTMEDCKPYKYRCSYEERTIDHVIPRAQGGRSTFLNTVTCCRYCNEVRKRNHTPEQAGMRLIRKPYVPVRKVGEIVIPNFVFNPQKPSHQAYFEISHKKFSHVA